MSRLIILVVDKDPLGRPVEIVELTLAHRPEKRRKPQRSKAQGDGYQKCQTGHCLAFPKRSEFPTTTMELSDMAIAAINGVTNPASAIGTAHRL